MESHSFKIICESAGRKHTTFYMKNTEHRDTKKAWRLELLSVICKSSPLKWTQALLLSYTNKHSRMGVSCLSGRLARTGKDPALKKLDMCAPYQEEGLCLDTSFFQSLEAHRKQVS